jgi:NAD(P) transhydrogenase subunit alpha
MPITLAVPTETADAESRVAITPDVVKKLSALGVETIVQAGAGMPSFYPDGAYQAAGAKITANRAEILATGDVVVCVQTLPPDEISTLKRGAVLMGVVPTSVLDATLQAASSAHVTLLSMDRVPRISRAQAMDVLSSQSNLAGYRAVIEAATFYNRAFPMMMTAAGTVAAAKVFVMGAGVAGLQAIATARRLGAIVSATDVRLAAKEQVQSLGAKFVMIEDDETKAAETAGGYAREMSDAYKQKQADLIADTLQKQDIVITTALIPGRPAPRLVTAQMVATMKPGSVIVDMAVEAGGNVERSVPGQVVMQGGVTIVGYKNLPSRIAHDASALYARNMLAFLGLVVKDRTLSLNFEDDIIKATTLTHAGQATAKGS